MHSIAAIVLYEVKNNYKGGLSNNVEMVFTGQVQTVQQRLVNPENQRRWYDWISIEPIAWNQSAYY